MRSRFMFVLPLALALAVGATAAEIENEENIEVKSDDGKTEYKMKVKRKDKDYVGFHDNREYVLRGEAATKIEREGDYVIVGRPSRDGEYFETTEVRPAVVEDRRVIEERPVVREREVRVKDPDPPVFKVGPLEIND